ncbi:putative transcription factor GAGA-Binding-like family [Helianthus anomalus]
MLFSLHTCVVSMDDDRLNMRNLELVWPPCENNCRENPWRKEIEKTPSTQKENGNSSGHRVKKIKRNVDAAINGIDMDISGIPIPVCTYTGAPQQCHRWGLGG